MYVPDIITETKCAYGASAQDYVSKNSDMNVMKNWADKFIDKLRENGGKKIIDIGCGPGRDLKYFSEQGFEVTGMDLVPEFLEIARRNAPKARIFQGDFSSISDAEMGGMDCNFEEFDGIWSCASFMHLPKSWQKNSMQAHNHILKPNGIMYMAVRGGGKGDDPLPASPKYGGHSKYFYSFGEEEFKELLTSSGFGIEDFVREEKHATFLNALARKI